MTQIASSKNGHCLDYGISIMRLALGYEAGLPAEWDSIMDRSIESVVQLTALAFPNREVLFWCLYKPNDCPSNACYQGTLYNLPDDNSWLVAFTYGDEDNGHFVVGHPVIFGGEPKLSLIVGVKIDAPL